jgi:DNA-binding transcriptional ArsR family regulator
MTRFPQHADASDPLDVFARRVIVPAGDRESSPPQFLQLAGHPLRWRLLSELAHSDRRVGELCELAGRRQSLVSYHLRQLRDGGLVSMRRSAADGRDTYYVLDLARCGELLTSAGGSLHPRLAPTPRARAGRERGPAQARVLFLCTGFATQRFDCVISLCDRAREICPEFPEWPGLIHWSIPDPAREPGTTTKPFPPFERTTDELAARIPFLLELIVQTTHAQEVS